MNSDESNQNLLQAAARAVGIEGYIQGDGTVLYRGRSKKGHVGSWNPLEDMDEALKLSLALRLKVSFGDGTLLVSVGDYSIVDNLDDDGAALRRAIVRAAAHVGNLPR